MYRCIGALDCTLIKISSPGGKEPEVYRNRKNFLSLNVQGVCHANFKFLNIVYRWPGSAHDSTIFQHSALRARFERNELRDILSLHQLVDILENDSDGDELLDIYMEPPEVTEGDVDEDSDKSDDDHEGDINHLPRQILHKGGEIRHAVDDEYDADDLIPLAQLFPQAELSCKKK
ncbi:hypothetical protein D910_04686 [Dendroctonus ponderosae]|uniref:DDE Tnp4 domain-containing protein n=1 Tax=Dendroctonus ponderosae TaxID=77166 RepID=U4U9K6_DENPD|nr:hypothetical protein D910_04686 [Dendroctonus ponderosae]